MSEIEERVRRWLAVMERGARLTFNTDTRVYRMLGQRTEAVPRTDGDVLTRQLYVELAHSRGDTDVYEISDMGRELIAQENTVEETDEQEA